MPRQGVAQVAGEGAGPAVDTIAVDPLESDTSKSVDADERATQLELIEVTGSRILRSDYETAQPVFSIGKADIERSGKTSITEILQDLAIAGSAANDAQNSSATGSREVDLRNLGSQRVLVLGTAPRSCELGSSSRSRKMGNSLVGMTAPSSGRPTNWRGMR